MATGWLGWSPEQALHTPIPQIVLALEGRTEWHRKTHGIPDPEPQATAKPDVALRLRQAFGQLAAKAKQGGTC